MERVRFQMFRRILADEVEDWKDEGVITDHQARILSQRYELEQVQGETRTLQMMAIYVIGAVLILGAASLFMAANWTEMSKGLKMGLMSAFTLGAYGLGYVFHDRIPTLRLLGQGLVLLGTLLFGGTLVLMKELYALPIPDHMLAAAFTVVAFLMCLVTGNDLIALVSLAGSLAWLIAFADTLTGAPGDVEPLWLLASYSAGVMAVFGPVAWVNRSGLVMVATIGLSFATALAITPEAPLAWVLVPAAFWGIGLLEDDTGKWTWLCQLSRGVGFVGVFVFACVLAVVDIAEMIVVPPFGFETFWSVAAVAYLALWAAVTWRFGLVAQKANPRHLVVLAVTGAAVLGLAVAAVVPWAMVAFAMGNLALILLAVTLLYDGLAEADRGSTWAGLVVAAAFVGIRVLDAKPSPGALAGLFAVLGIGVLVAGSMLERALRRRKEVAHD